MRAMTSGLFCGNVWESNPAIRREADANGFEDREGHQCPIRPHEQTLV